MEYSIGDEIDARINKIKENGCYCSFLPLWQNQFGFLPQKLMRSLYDKDGNFIKKVGDNIVVVIYNITDKGIILSDVATYEKKEAKAKIDDFTTKYDVGSIFEAKVIRVTSTKVHINIGEVPGVIKKEDTYWNEIDRLEDLLFEGETIKAVFIKQKTNQLYFSLKLLNEKPYEDNLYDLSLDDLLKFTGHESNMFIGQAKKYHYGLFIENLYSDNENQKGKLLIDPIFGYNIRAIVPNASFNVEENKFYKVTLKLNPKNTRQERNQLFQFYAINIKETINPYKADVDLTFEKFTSPAGNVATAHLLAEVGKNMYSSKDRMFFELVQNADDAASEKGVHVKVTTKGDYLIVQHNGNSFDKDDFEAITSAANGTKKANENKTGYKGIGFKSVFTDSEEVFIKTGGYQFKFDKSDTRFTNFESFYFIVNRLKTEDEKQFFLLKYNREYIRFRGVADIPWQLEPIWVDSFPEELGEDFTASNVAIALRLGENKISGDNGYSQAIDDIISNPRFMLFLRNTKRIDFNGKHVSKAIKGGVITLKNSFNTNRIEYFKREDFEIKVNNTVFEKNGIDVRIKIDEQDEVSGKIIEAKFVNLHDQELENIPKKIAINNSTAISFAISISEDGEIKPDTKCTEISMFAFLPTLVKDFKFPFYINANFILDPPRQRILGDNPWNFYLMQEIARCLVRWCASLNDKQDKNALNILISQYFDEGSADTKQLAYHFNTAYKSALESEAFILNQNGELSKQDEITIDKTDLYDIIGADLLCKIIRTNKSLPSDKIDSSILEENIFEKVETLKFDDVIKAISNNDDFNKWFISADKEQKEQLYKWIDNNNTSSKTDALTTFVLNLPLFQFGEGYKSYENIDFPNSIITTKHIIPIKEILTKLNFKCSNNIFDESHPLFGFIEAQDEEDLFKSIKDRDFGNLDVDERKSLYIALKDFDGVGEARLKEIALFRNMNDNFKPLCEMIAYRDDAPTWLFDYVLCEEDNCQDLSDYLISNEDAFEKVIQTHYKELNISISTLYTAYQNKWTGQFTRQIIDDHCEIDNNILAIIEESDTTTKKHFLDSIEKLDLLSTSSYKNCSYEYRVLHIALSTLKNPSDFSSKIYFNGQCINNFSVSDDIECKFIMQNGESKNVKMSLAKLLPQYKDKSDSIEKIKNLFENKKDLDKFFDAKPKSVYEVHKKLNQYLKIPESSFSIWNVDGNAHQYLFTTYYRRAINGWYDFYVPKIELDNETDEFINELMDFLFDNKISIKESPFTYHLNEYFKSKYFKCDYAFESEQILPKIEQWANDVKKKQYLIQNGVIGVTSHSVKFRQLFLENQPIEFIDKLSPEELASAIKFIATADGFKRPFRGKNQKDILLQLKENLSDEWNLQKMKKESKEWNTSEYNNWKDNDKPLIFIYPDILPSQLSYNNELLLYYKDGNYNFYYDEQSKKLFISNSNKIEDILFEIAKEGKSGFNFDDYRQLCLEGKVTVSKEDIAQKEKKIEDLEKSNREKDKIIELYRANYGDLKDETTKPEVYPVTSGIDDVHKNAQDEILAQSGQKVIERDGLSIEKQVVAHKDAEQVVREKLEADGYDCSNWIMEESDSENKYKKWHSVNQVKDIINPNKEIINLVIKSAISGYIFLSATDFEFLTSSSNNVLMVWDGKSVHSVTAEDIFNKDSNVNLIFDMEYTPKHYYAALSKVFQYVKRTTFAVKNPSYNASDTIESFGMDSKTEGIQELFDDNAL